MDEPHTQDSKFQLIDETTTCEIKRGATIAELLLQTSLIIWDEAIMTKDNVLKHLIDPFEIFKLRLTRMQRTWRPTTD